MNGTPEKPFYLLVREARRGASLRQGELAAKVGCTQSALSMFESGKPGVIAKDTLARLAETLGIAVPAGLGDGDGAVSGIGSSGGFIGSDVVNPVFFCPDFKCLSNYPYLIGGQIFFIPLGLAGCGVRCALCGELLECTCPQCGVKVAARGGCCTRCGAALVQWPDGFAENVAGWVAAQRSAIADIRGIMGAKPALWREERG